jgi:hypothetical protein
MVANSVEDTSYHRYLLLLLVAIVIIMLIVGLVLFSRGHQKGENYISLKAKTEAQITGKDPCDLLDTWLVAAKLANDKVQVRTIQQAQKFLGCRNVQKRL